MSEYKEYDSMKFLLKSPEWWTWVKFIQERREKLREQVLSYVRDNDIHKANGTVAVIDDIDKQLALFKARLHDLENKEE